MFHSLTFLALLVVSSSFSYGLNTKPFPDDFMFGVGTSAYQIEGAWNEDGKGESIWDHYVHNHPESIDDNSTGDVACDSYHKLEEDIELLKELGVNHYRFSIAWIRILPNGKPDQINEAGVQYYKKLIKGLKANNIEPFVTIFHWDTPQVFEEEGGFINESIIPKFVEYARICFELFGDDVKYWVTFNEPMQICLGGYGYGYKAPGIKQEGILDYICAHNLIKAHASAYHLYHNKYKPTQKGKISIVIDTVYFIPKTVSEEDKEAVERAFAFIFGWFVNPIFVGDYPEIMKIRIANRSKAEGYIQSRLPEFTAKEIDYIRGTHDFFGVNMYTSILINAVNESDVVERKPTRKGDIAIAASLDPTWKTQVNGWPFGWFVNPIFVGDYPEIMKIRIANRSKAEGYIQSRLPEFTAKEIDYIRGTHDFFGVNMYTSILINAVNESDVVERKPTRKGDIAIAASLDPTWKTQVNGWPIYPLGIRLLMKYIKDTYDNPTIIITENGMADNGGIHDDDRVHFLTEHLSQVRYAIEKDQVKIIGYTCWSFMDNMEWENGYRLKFGLIDVDFNSVNRTRTKKTSAKVFAQITRNRSLADIEMY